MKLVPRIDGSAQFRGALSRIAAPDGLADVLEAAAEDVRRAALAKLADGKRPESHSGGLSASLSVEAGSDGASMIVGTPLDHGWHLEFGTLGGPARPWLEPALDETRAGILARVKSWLAASGKRSASQ